MIEGNRVLAVVPARGGSKGIPLKNLRTVGGQTLVGRAGAVAQKVPYIDRAVVSTDHSEIARAAEQAGLDAPFVRPTDLSGDRVADWDVLKHALTTIEEIDRTTYDIVLMLQPTSPSRTPEHIITTLKHLVEGEFDAVWTVSKTDPKFHPLKQLQITNSGELTYHDSRGSGIVARQQLGPVYHRNGIAYAIRRQCILDQGSIMGAKTGAVVIEEDVANIDTEADIQFAEFLLKAK